MKKATVIDISQHINNLLPQNFQNYSLEEQILNGPVKQLKIRLKELLYVLERVNPSIFRQVIEHIITIEEIVAAEEETKHKVRLTNGSLDNLYIHRLFELFSIISEIIYKKKLKDNLNEGYLFFLKWNKLNYCIKINKIEDLINANLENNIVTDNLFRGDLEKIEMALNDFFYKLDLLEIKVLFLGFCFWGNLNKLLKSSNEIIYITVENLPLINLRIFESLANILREIDNNSEPVSKLSINEIYNDIYDKTEGFEIKIEPWLIY